MKRAIPAAEFASGDGILVSRIPFESGFTSVLGQFIPVCFAGFNQFFLGREISPILFVHPLNRSSLTTRLEDFPGFGGRETDYFVLVRVADFEVAYFICLSLLLRLSARRVQIYIVRLKSAIPLKIKNTPAQKCLGSGTISVPFCAEITLLSPPSPIPHHTRRSLP